MSGGVDSSVAAALLKKQGFQVMGVFMRFWKEAEGENRCCSLDAVKRAKQVAQILKIPFYIFNFTKEFKKAVVDAFLKDYRLGLTPNPCVVCNKEIKLGLLLKRAKALSFDYVATGHYARKMGTKLYQSRNKEKDQSYFLWKLNREQLKHLLFPLSDYTKKEVRRQAKELGLPVFDTPESQEICFVEKEVNEFLKRHLKIKKGKIIDSRGNILGDHQGLPLYTLGQRKGIGLSQGPFWVKGKDFKKNLLIVTKNEKDLLKKELSFREVNWLSGKPPKLPAKLKAKIRSRHEASFGVLKKGNRFIFNKPQKAITPGQSVVFYRNSELLGGGIIS